MKTRSVTQNNEVLNPKANSFLPKFFDITLGVVSYLAYALFVLLLCLEIRAFDIGFYEKQFILNDTELVTGRSLNDLLLIAKDLILFLVVGDQGLLVNHFSDNEVLHMVDVYNLFRLAYFSQFVCLVVMLGIFVYFYRKKRGFFFFRQFRNLLFVTYLFLALAWVLYVSNGFTTIFIQFHELFFSNDLWILDPDTDLMIQMLPETFFSTMAYQILVLWVCFVVFTQVLVSIFLWKRKGVCKKDNG